MISIIDYGLGNVKAFSNIYKSLNIKHTIVKKSEDLYNSTKIILPGVGSFDWAMKKLEDSGFKEILNHLVLKKKIPILGICVGMQLMANKSEEGSLNGLGWIKGEVKKISINQNFIILPHMGWNNVELENNILFKGIENPYFYFLHSYYFDPINKDSIIGTSYYGIKFTSIVNRENVFGIQFHPEKSHDNGIRILSNFARL